MSGNEGNGRHLLISVHFHDGRYHSTGPWPPAPARLFQALTAAAAQGAKLPAAADAGLRWLEGLPAPVLVAPPVRTARGYTAYVPNNDLDRAGGQIERAVEYWIPKSVRPRLFDATRPLRYLWPLAGHDEAPFADLRQVVLRLYRLGWGIDMAWANAEIIDAADARALLEQPHERVHRPWRDNEIRKGGVEYECPAPGSLQSLIVRYQATLGRLEAEGRRVYFRQPPRPRFAAVSYDVAASRTAYELRQFAAPARLARWPLTQAAALAQRVRDQLAQRLASALPGQAALIERVVIGRGAGSADKLQRVRLIPLPSIGHDRTDPDIRRVVLEVPPDCPLSKDDIAWAASGLHLGTDPATGELLDEALPLLIEAADDAMAKHYGFGAGARRGARHWRSVTPLALPAPAARRRIDPARQATEAKDGTERAAEQHRAAGAVVQALRHAGVGARARQVRVQPEPTQPNGVPARHFASGTRFSAHQLWHAEIDFDDPVEGPLLIGDGRYLGLGLFAPAEAALPRVMVCEVDNPPPASARVDILRALRRTLMALDRDLASDRKVSQLFSGHEADGAPARSGQHRHVFLAAGAVDGRLTRLYVFRPDAADRSVRLSTDRKRRFDRVTSALRQIRAGRHGVLGVAPAGEPGATDTLCGRSRHWRSVTEYRTTRRARSTDDIAQFVETDVRQELSRRQLPAATVTLLESAEQAQGIVKAHVALSFAGAVRGPILLGSGAHRGDGLFAAVPASSARSRP